MSEDVKAGEDMGAVETADEAPAAKAEVAKPEAVASARGDGADQLLDHNYDGIQEYDNPLPGWWTAIFWLTFLFVFPYLLYYHAGGGPLVADEYKSDATEVAKLQAEAALQNAATNENLALLLKDPAAMSAAEQVFVAKCAACHGPQGQGGIGPNLTDEYWIHGAQLIEIHTTIDQGVPKKGMEPWGKKLKPLDVRRLAAYVSTLREKYPNPPNAKKPQGKRVAQ